MVVAVLADWAENFVLLGQLERYLASGENALQSEWVRIASAATVTKLTFTAGTFVIIVGIAVLLLIRAR